MRCIHCGNPLPKDSKFCQYCGEKLSLTKEQSSEAAETAVITEEKEAVSVRSHEDLNTEPKKPTSLSEQKHRSEKRSRRKASAVIPWVLFLLTAICFGVLLIHTFNIQNQSKQQVDTITNLQLQIDELESTVEKQLSAIESQTANFQAERTEFSAARKKAEMFDLLCMDLRSGNIGWGSEDFRVSEGIILLSKGTTKYIDLFTQGESPQTVNFYTINDCCTVDIKANSWINSTKVSITGHSVGVNVALFSNTANSDTFKVLIIVTE